MMTKTKHSTTHLLAYLMMLLLGISMLACAASDSGDYLAQSPFMNNVSPDNPLVLAENALKRHQPAKAQNLYSEALMDKESAYYGVAATGKAVTDLMLLLGDDAARKIIAQNLKADRKTYNIEQIIWANEGMLFWFSDNIPWEDTGSYKGVRSIMSDKIPWKASRLDSLDAFVEPLTSPVNSWVDDLVVYANALTAIEMSLDVALANKDFTHYYLPYEVFHDDQLGLVLGRPELHMLKGSLALMRASLYMLAAYDHTWTPVQLMSRQYWEGVLNDPEHPDHVPELKTIDDYMATYTNTHMFRSIRDKNMLEAARRAYKAGMMSMKSALDEGATFERGPTTLEWRQVDPAMLEKLSGFFGAMAEAADGPVKIPHVTPTMTLDLSPVFKEGRVLPQDVNWLIEEELPTPPDGGEMVGPREYVLNPDAFNSMLKGVVSPDPVETDFVFELEQSEELDTFQKDLIGDWASKVEDAYNIQ